VDYLVVGGEGAGEAKLEKAQNLGVKIMHELEFKKIIYNYFGR
jgi:NAD-dependent DNA ligase